MPSTTTGIIDDVPMTQGQATTASRLIRYYYPEITGAILPPRQLSTRHEQGNHERAPGHSLVPSNFLAHRVVNSRREAWRKAGKAGATTAH